MRPAIFGLQFAAFTAGVLLDGYCQAQEPAVRATLRGHGAPVRCVAISPNGATVASGDRDGVTILWDVATGRRTATLRADALLVECLAFSPDGKTLAAGLKTLDGGEFVAWDVATQRRYTVLARNPENYPLRMCCAFSPDGKTLATNINRFPVSLWDTATWRQKGSLGGHKGGVNALSFSPDGRTLASAGSDPDGAESPPGKVVLWDVAGRKERVCVRVPEDRGGLVNALAYRPDGKAFATGGFLDGKVTLWSDSARPDVTLAGHGELVSSVAFCAGGKAIASAAWDGFVKVRDAETGRVIHEVRFGDGAVNMGEAKQLRSMVVSRDGTTLAVSVEDDVRVFDLAGIEKGKQ